MLELVLVFLFLVFSLELDVLALVLLLFLLPYLRCIRGYVFLNSFDSRSALRVVVARLHFSSTVTFTKYVFF